MNYPNSKKLDSDDLLPLLYDELRRVARGRLKNEQPGQSLDTTGLVHEVYLRLKETMPDLPWHSRAHFFGAAAEAMRRILVERARSRGRLKRGEGVRPVELQANDALYNDDNSDEVLGVHESLNELEKQDPAAAALVKLRYFAGLTHQEAAAELGLTRRQADGLWTLARTWLFRRLRD